MDFAEWQRRLTVIITLAGLMLLTFTGRLYQKTVIEYKDTVQAAENQYMYRKEVDGQRGSIVVKLDDHTYYPLATNEERYEVIVVPNQVLDPKTTAKGLAPVIELSENDIYNKINNKKFYIPPLRHRLSRQQYDKITALHLRGVLLYPESVRIYPEKSLASQLLGFVNNDGEGNYGLEGTFDQVLRGENGYQVGEKDNQNRLINVNDEVKAKTGATIVLTIDRDIQRYVETTLADAVKNYQADSGSVVIMDPKTGAIIAMASVPTYDPNDYNTVAKDNQNVYINPVISNSWEPGSIMKPLVMAMAIDKGLVEPDTKETFGASIRVLNHDIYTAEKKAFGTETMTQVLENSDNVAMVWLANKLGNDSQYEEMKKFGFGDSPKLNLKNVAGGFMPDVKKWNDLTRATLSFGQGIAATPLQMVTAYSALANKGVMMQPYIVSDVLDEQGTISTIKPTEVGHVVSEDTSNKISLMLESVVENGLGKRAKVPGYRIGGKTGTAQVADPNGGYYEDRHIGSFAGYFPISNPQYAMVVKLDNPKSVQFAESSAGPTFGQIAAWVLYHQQVLPDKPQ
jgi:cell division protein FtsI/penicillin-binding protein 2